MHVKSMVLEGFKSYGKRIEINGFDVEFNAITGLNGSGKSNILDAICFVLGITALHNVRATSLQELVYKSGQAGIKKASVTITFDNKNKQSSPIGYEGYDEITVTRQVVIDGKNKYLINGTNVSNKRVQDMFCSVQLNVNNPHFLIMQGRITKVLNMKPMEILSMIEEAAGTRMYEEKKEVAMKTIDKKNCRLKEINTILDEEIGPKLLKLREERAHFVEFQRVERELEHCRKIVIAYRYVTTLKDNEKAESDVQAVKEEIAKKKTAITDGKKEILTIDELIKETTEKLKNDKGNELEMLEQELKTAEKKENKLSAEVKSNSENIKAQKKVVEQFQINLKDDKKVLAQKEAELQEVGGMFEKLREKNQTDSAAVIALQAKLQKISAGLLENEDGEDASLEEQLMNAKQQNSHAKTEIKQCETTLKHNKDLLKKKQGEIKTADSDYEKNTKELKEQQKQYDTLVAELNKIQYDEGTLENLQQRRAELMNEIRSLQEKLDVFTMRNHRLRFEYQDPHPNFDRSNVKGLVCTLFKLKDKTTADALDTVAGGKLYNVIVDTDKTSKAILEHGQLQQRTTIIPLNKIVGREIDADIVKSAQDLVGEENVQPALSLIEFDEYLRPAMSWIFGNTLVCKDIRVAKTVAFHRSVQKRCVTLDGDVCDPSGILSGGARSKTGSILITVDEFKSLQKELNAKEQAFKEVTNEIAKLRVIAEKFASLKQKLDLRKHEIMLIKQRLEQTTFHINQGEIETLQAEIQQLEEKMEAAKHTAVKSEQRAKTLETQLKDAGNIRDKLRYDAENNLKIAQKNAEKSQKEWQQYEHQSEILNLEIKELHNTIINTEEQLINAQEKLAGLEEQKKELEETLKTTNEQVAELQENFKAQKNLINQKNKEIQKLIAKKDGIIEESREYELDIKKLNHEIVSIENNAIECKKRVKDLLRKNDWINQDKAYFGEAGGIYDFTKNDPKAIGQKLQQLEGQRDKMSKTVNKRSINLLSQEEERFNETVKKKNIVENDKSKILKSISKLEEKKKEILLQAWEQINRDFGSIFSTLLPGADAQLQPTQSKNVLDGLEVKVGFSGVWKESLGELSGGQRSLVALSLILAMLRFKPAPLYILDEVDAALDLSHTQNIGTMLKRHFTQSQFIIVSLKDGMFNNANVLFTTKFVDGMSTINRTEKMRKPSNRQQNNDS